MSGGFHTGAVCVKHVYADVKIFDMNVKFNWDPTGVSHCRRCHRQKVDANVKIFDVNVKFNVRPKAGHQKYDFKFVTLHRPFENTSKVLSTEEHNITRTMVECD